MTQNKFESLIELGFTDGTTIRAVENFSYTENFLDPFGSLTFFTRPPRERLVEYDDKLQKGSLIRLYIDSNQQAVMMIVKRTIKISAEGVSFSINCKSVLETLKEGNVDPYFTRDFKSDTDVLGVLLEVLKHFGFKAIVVDTADNIAIKMGESSANVKKKKNFKKIDTASLQLKDFQASPGDTAYSFCQKILGRLGLVMSVDAKGVIYLAYPN